MSIDRHFEWTPELAYVIGLMTADGNLSPDGRHLEICSKDFENVVHVHQCLGLRTKIRLKRRGTEPFLYYYRTQFGNIAFYRFLQGIGLRPNKSRTLGVLTVPHDVFRDFLRGLWDGDGGFTTFNHPESRWVQWKARFSSGSPMFLDWLHGLIVELYGVSGKIYFSGRVHKLTYHQRSGLELLRVMYYAPEIMCLSRKRQQAEGFLGERRLQDNNAQHMVAPSQPRTGEAVSDAINFDYVSQYVN